MQRERKLARFPGTRRRVEKRMETGSVDEEQGWVRGGRVGCWGSADRWTSGLNKRQEIWDTETSGMMLVMQPQPGWDPSE